jgi:hypothetical protein
VNRKLRLKGKIRGLAESMYEFKNGTMIRFEEKRRDEMIHLLK